MRSSCWAQQTDLKRGVDGAGPPWPQNQSCLSPVPSTGDLYCFLITTVPMATPLRWLCFEHKLALAVCYSPRLSICISWINGCNTLSVVFAATCTYTQSVIFKVLALIQLLTSACVSKHIVSAFSTGTTWWQMSVLPWVGVFFFKIFDPAGVLTSQQSLQTAFLFGLTDLTLFKLQLVVFWRIDRQFTVSLLHQFTSPDLSCCLLTFLNLHAPTKER